jgi:hypothetical protein
MARVLPMSIGRMKSRNMHRIMEDRVQGETLMTDTPSTLLAMGSCAITPGTTQEERMEGMHKDGNDSSSRL